MFAKSALLYFVLTLGLGSVKSQCYNSDTYRKYIEGDYRSCVWIRFQETRRLTYCTDPEVIQACPQTCGYCCNNDPNYTFRNKLNPDKLRGCEWITKKEKRVERRRELYCNIGDGITFENDVNIRDACPLACDFCFEQVSASPSISNAPSVSVLPTVSPTSTPSSHPSASPTSTPSATPTARPSSSPSSSPTSMPSATPTRTPTNTPTSTPSASPTVSINPTSKPTSTPSATPTSSPSANPTSSPSARPTSTPSASPTTSIEPSLAPNYRCDIGSDDPDFTFQIDFNEYTVGCDWLTRSNPETRKEKYCPRFEIYYHCRFACESCQCLDNWNFRFELDNPELGKRNCQWLTKNSERIETRRNSYCFEEDGSLSDVGSNCEISCGVCED